ncbi:MAG: glycosyl transferase family 2 [Firmicutes bacterium]|nr:glycosyl transferase family 2 [Bacillota bacterium]
MVSMFSDAHKNCNCDSQDSEEPTVLIILVNYKRPFDTVACIESLLNQSYRSWRCVVYENGSGDDSFLVINSRLAESGRFIQCERKIRDGFEVGVFSKSTNLGCGTVAIVKGDENLGFAGGNNAAINFAKRFGVFGNEFVWLLNNDTVANDDALFNLIKRMRMPGAERVGLCGATLLYFGSKNIVQCFGGARYGKWLGSVAELGNGKTLSLLPSSAEVEPQLSYVSGASMFARNTFLEAVGPMCEEYFLYYEEVDWAVRGERLGFCLGYAPDAIVWHKEGAVLGSGRAITRSPLAEHFGLSSRLLFTKKHYPLALLSIWLVGWLQFVKRIFNRQWINAKVIGNALLLKKYQRN